MIMIFGFNLDWLQTRLIKYPWRLEYNDFKEMGGSCDLWFFFSGTCDNWALLWTSDLFRIRMNVATSSSLGRPRLTLSFFYNPLSLHIFNTDGNCVCLSYFVTRGWGTFLFAVSGVIFLVAQADEKPAQTENIRCTHARDLYVNDPNDVVQEFPTALCLNIEVPLVEPEEDVRITR